MTSYFHEILGVLAQLPEPGSYTSTSRILLVLIMVLHCLAFCQWVDKDAMFVRRMNREVWNGIVLGGGAVGLALWLLMPWNTTGPLPAAFGLWLVITSGICPV